MERKITVNVIHFQRGKIKPEFYLCSKKSAENIEMIMSNTNEKKWNEWSWTGLGWTKRLKFRGKKIQKIYASLEVSKCFIRLKGSRADNDSANHDELWNRCN